MTAAVTGGLALTAGFFLGITLLVRVASVMERGLDREPPRGRYRYAPAATTPATKVRSGAGLPS